MNTNTTITGGSIVVGIGALGLAVYSFINGDVVTGVNSVIAALTAFGLKYQLGLHTALTTQLQRKNMI